VVEASTPTSSLAGDGPLRRALHDEAAAAGLAAYVHELGMREDVEEVLGGLDTLIMTSDAEGIPGVLIEAQMTGLPVVSFAVGGIASVVDDGRTRQARAQPGNVDAMSEQTARLLRDPASRDAMHIARHARARSGSSQLVRSTRILRKT
jgi:glycosyltransferase involved in cell wall biosynthesis